MYVIQRDDLFHRLFRAGLMDLSLLRRHHGRRVIAQILLPLHLASFNSSSGYFINNLPITSPDILDCFHQDATQAFCELTSVEDELDGCRFDKVP